MKDDKIVEAARVIHGQFWRATVDESTGDKQAVAVTSSWQQMVACKNIECEVPIAEHLSERIDLIDFSSKTAYELKVSGKNPQHEFYKDIFKVLIYNQNHDIKLERLIFITESVGVERLRRGLGGTVIEMLLGCNLAVIIIGI